MADVNPDLQVAFALRDNPFNPAYAVPSLPLFANLAVRPLVVHKAAELRAYYVDEAGPFAQHLKDFRKKLRFRGIRESPPSRRGDSGVVLVAGPRGTGKTSLASTMIALLKGIQPAGEPPWCTFDSGIEQETDSQDLSQFRQQIELLKATIEKGSVDNDYCCVLVDNVTADTLSAALSVYDAFQGRRFIHLFLTTNDPRLSGSEPLNSARPIVKYVTSTLAADQAVIYVEKRIEHFRDPRLAVLVENAELHLYPYDASNIRASVATLGTHQDAAGAITLRVFNQYLDRHLRAKLESFGDGYDIQKETRDALLVKRIDLSGGAVL
jgi:hypothetical protein